jgi:hypothetical protein
MKNQRMVQIVQNQGVPLRAAKPRPNAYCHCGSGKKLKNCCKTETKYFFSQKPKTGKYNPQTKKFENA